MLTLTELDDPEKAVYHESFGFACLKHGGVKGAIEDLIEAANQTLVEHQEKNVDAGD
jgi:hypothetical protein